VTIDIKKIGVVGCGTMGSGICEVVARSGFDVIFSEMDDGAERAGRERIERSVGRAVARGKLQQAEADELLGHLSSTTELADLGNCDLVFEAVPEKLELKKKTFAALDKVLKN
jgi:3-hydroxybutyryl-CoA dehydrogenase